MTKPAADAVVEVFSGDAAGGGYIYTRPDHLSARYSNARMSEAIAAAITGAELRVVDLGCGDGTYTLELARRANIRAILGIDPAREAIAHAQALAAAAGDAKCRFAACGIDDVPGAPRYDIAVLRGVLHHLADPEAAVRKALAIADRVVILEPNGANPVLKLIERMSDYHRRHGEQSFAPALVRRWIERNGGRVATRRFINLVPFFCPAPMARALKAVEPLVEALPAFRAVACGQMIFVAESPRG